MSNILAIAHKELKGYFASPIAYVVIGLYAIMFGYFFYALLLYFDRQSMQMAGLGGAQPVNVNEGLIRPVFLNTTVIFLFILPMVTMRTYSEEKRSGTIELLLTSPLTDFQIIAGKFLGAMGLYAAMLAVTIPHIAALFWLGNPEWIPIVVTYLGLLLMGGCFISVGLFISSLTKNQIVAVMGRRGGFARSPRSPRRCERPHALRPRVDRETRQRSHSCGSRRLGLSIRNQSSHDWLDLTGTPLWRPAHRRLGRPLDWRTWRGRPVGTRRGREGSRL